MNSKFVLVSALAAGGMVNAAIAQTGPQIPAAPSAPTAQPQPMPAPQAVLAKIALIEFEDAAAATKEGQKTIADLQKKYEPRKDQLDKQRADIDSLTKQAQSQAASMSDEERASRARTIDTKQKQLQLDSDDAQTAYNADVSDAIAKIAKKLGPVVIKYVQENGYTMLLDNTGQQGGLNVLWAPGTDISQAVVDAYDANPGVAASAPSASAAPRPHPNPVAPKPAAPKPAAPKQ